MINPQRLLTHLIILNEHSLHVYLGDSKEDGMPVVLGGLGSHHKGDRGEMGVPRDVRQVCRRVVPNGGGDAFGEALDKDEFLTLCRRLDSLVG